MKKEHRNLLITIGVLSLLFGGFCIVVDPFAFVADDGGGGGELPVYYDSLPSAPVLNEITPNLDPDGIIELSWSVSTRVWYYNVYRQISGIEQKIKIGVTSNSFIDGVSKDNGLYYYRIEAVNNLGKVMSNVESVMINVQEDPLPPEPIKPDAPILNTIIPKPSTDGEIRLEWNLVPDAINYVVYRTKEGEDIEILDDSISNNYYDDFVTNGIYYYKVKAGNNIDEYSDFSNEESVIVDIPSVPDVPEAYYVTYEVIDSGIEIVVSWSEVTCDSYNLYRAIKSDIQSSGFVLIEEGLTSTSYSEILTGTGSYTYKVSAINDLGESEQSNPVVINITGDGVEPDELLDDYTWLYVLLGVLGVAVVPVVILTRRKKRK